MSVFSIAAELEKSGKPFVLVSIIESSGSTPRSRGHMVVLPDGSTRGTVGGGPAELMVIGEAIEALKEGLSRKIHYRLDSGRSSDSIKMVCGGDMTFFAEVFQAGLSLFLAGGGFVNQAVAGLAEYIGIPYSVADSREGFTADELFPAALGRYEGGSISALIEEAASRGDINEHTALLIATHNHDDQALSAALGTTAFYKGMLGSRRKTALFFQKMLDKGYRRNAIDGIHAPVGLDLGAETPEEIALSIMSEIFMIRNEVSGRPMKHKLSLNNLVVVRGAGDLATGVIIRLKHCGFDVAALDIPEPTVIRRTVSLAQALFDGQCELDGVNAVRADTLAEADTALKQGIVPVIADPDGKFIPHLHPFVVVDAILAKKNLGTTREMAPIVIGLGPGFTAGSDVDAVIETNRGHDLGRVILEGPAQPNTGVPGTIGGKSAQRVLRAPCRGKAVVLKDIGSLVEEGDPLIEINGKQVCSPFDGVVRGMISDGLEVPEGFKIGDVDPRGEAAYCYSVSDKARAIAGGVLEAVLRLKHDLSR